MSPKGGTSYQIALFGAPSPLDSRALARRDISACLRFLSSPGEVRCGAIEAQGLLDSRFRGNDTLESVLHPCRLTNHIFERRSPLGRRTEPAPAKAGDEGVLEIIKQTQHNAYYAAICLNICPRASLSISALNVKRSLSAAVRTAAGLALISS